MTLADLFAMLEVRRKKFKKAFGAMVDDCSLCLKSLIKVN